MELGPFKFGVRFHQKENVIILRIQQYIILTFKSNLMAIISALLCVCVRKQKIEENTNKGYHKCSHELHNSIFFHSSYPNFINGKNALAKQP